MVGPLFLLLLAQIAGSAAEEGDLCQVVGGGTIALPECFAAPGYATWTLVVRGERRFFGLYQPFSSTEPPFPALIAMSDGQQVCRPGPPMTSAARYGHAYVCAGMGRSRGDGGWEFGNDGVASSAEPLPCGEENREIPYLAAILDVLAAEETIDERRVFTSGFSLNSMFAAYASFCFQGRIAGLWQGGSGLKLSREPPLMPEREGDCRKSDFVALGTSCVAEAPCADCEYFPVDPILAGGEPANALRVCTVSYEDDFLVATTRDMYATLSSRGQHEVAMLEFPAGRGHSTPLQLSAWIVGCLGIVPACSDECERWFLAECVGEGGEDAFTACMDAVHEGGAHGCAAQCAPTIAMLSTVEGPTVTQPAARAQRLAGFGGTAT